MSYFVYILSCSDSSSYTGITWNLEKRLIEHNKGKVLSTKGKLPVKMVYWEQSVDKYIAAKREKEIKGWRREKKERLINKAVYTEECNDEVRE